MRTPTRGAQTVIVRSGYATRGTREQRGYPHAHRKLRKQVAIQVEAGQASCARCTKPIAPGTAWHLDHTDDRTGYLGPSHATCNIRARGGV